MARQDIQLILDLMAGDAQAGERRRMLRLFAETNGWHPSDDLEDYFSTDDFATGHILVEHGLQNSAVISFLKRDTPLAGLDRVSVRNLLSISYNNLVDWHFFPDPQGITVIYNRHREPSPRYFSLHGHPASWHSKYFDTLTADGGRPEIGRLDHSLIQTVSYWKRELAFLLRSAISNLEVSALMNSILFVRALEDLNAIRRRSRSQVLIEICERSRKHRLKDIFSLALAELGAVAFPNTLQDQQSALDAFDGLPKVVLIKLFGDFYSNRFAPYDYDFALISKQALSRIYEKYVSVLREPSDTQDRLFADWSSEVDNRELGSYYTPQYVARFFARFLHDSIPQRVFRNLRTLDPACGSGIFLREVMEMQCAYRADSQPRAVAHRTISGLTGIDIDSGAIRATELSLSLLHLAITGALPAAMDLHVAEATELFQSEPGRRSQYDAVLSNPPFRAWDRLPQALRAQYKSYLGELAAGRPDASLALLKVGMDAVRPGGLLMYILPHSFLLSDSAALMRQAVANEFDVMALVDLSAIDVFPEVGAYVILLVAQRRSSQSIDRPRAVVAKCRDFVGQALADVLDHKETSTAFYDITLSSQKIFQRDRWHLFPGRLNEVSERLQGCPRLSDYCAVREGAVSGDDDVFITRASRFPKSEQSVWKPFLSDREMLTFATPTTTSQHLFNPFASGKRLSRAQVESRYPKTWAYLKSHQPQLSKRSQVKKRKVEWWAPHRSPQFVFQPKIVCPHLLLTPRFSIDSTGQFAVSRCPVIYPKDARPPSSLEPNELLAVLSALLNTSLTAWQLAHGSHAYGRGYSLVEPKTLGELRIPDLRLCDDRALKEIVRLVKKRTEKAFDGNLDEMIEQKALALYGFSDTDLHLILATQRA